MTKRSTAGSVLGDPFGTNPADKKHTLHNVLEAWDYTRGGVAKVGILDSGYVYDHEDDLPIERRGFSDDYGDCSGSGEQANGLCEDRDDHGDSTGYAHGTYMTGLVGADDNSLGYVGIMPLGTTVSMKITHNPNISGQPCSSSSGTYCIEDDDFVAALDWASSEGLAVASMSFSGNFGASVDQALTDAYQTYDVLLLAGAPNQPTHPTWLVCRSSVMGVGGVDSLGYSQGEDTCEEVSAFVSGWTTRATCSGTAFCVPAGYDTAGGNSAATATAAGIAGLLRDYEPGLSAVSARTRLNYTAIEDAHDQLDAYKAIVNPLQITLVGPNEAQPYEICSWGSDPYGGTPPYTFEWYREGMLVSTEQTYADQAGSSDFFLDVYVTDAVGTVRSDGVLVDVDAANGSCLQ